MVYFVSFVVGFAVVSLLIITFCLFRMASLEDQQMEQLLKRTKMDRKKDSNIKI